MLTYFVVLLFVPTLTYCSTCEEIQKLPVEQKPSIGVLKSMEPSEIVSCLSHLAKEPIEEIEVDYIWQVIVDFYDGVPNIPQSVLAELHWVTPAISLKDYVNITMETIEVVRNFGLNYCLPLLHLAAIADRVRTDYAGKTPEDYTTYDLKALNYILCGFNRSEIERIHPTAYRESAFSIGMLNNCNPEVMKGFATLAVHKDAFGPAKGWTALIVKIVGCVVDYLPAATQKEVKMMRKTFEEKTDYLDDITENDYRIIYLLEKH